MPSRSKNPIQLTGSEAWQRLPEVKRRGVFKAALQIFAQSGFSKASMNALVEEAGISKGSLFQYFTSKQDLFDGVVALAVTQVKSRLKAVRDKSLDLPIQDRLDLLIESGFQFIDAHPHLAQIYFQLLQTGDAPFSKDRMRRLNQLSRGFLENLLQQAAESGELREDVDIEKSAFLLNAMDRLLAAAHAPHLAPSMRVIKSKSERLEWRQAFRLFVEQGLLRVGSKENK